MSSSPTCSRQKATPSPTKSCGWQCRLPRLDVTDGTGNAVVADTEKRLGVLDVVVANAGIAHRVPFGAMTDEKWDHTFDVDLKGILRIVRPAVPGMVKRGSGAIVALSSIMGVAYGWDEHVHYSSAKAGVVGLVRGLAVELARSGVRVNGVAPGYIRTAQLLSKEHSLGPEGAEAAASFIPMGPTRRAPGHRRRHRFSPRRVRATSPARRSLSMAGSWSAGTRCCCAPRCRFERHCE
jgi:3-oxoacyl-[acyl-carrier protein] reductase